MGVIPAQGLQAAVLCRLRRQHQRLPGGLPLLLPLPLVKHLSVNAEFPGQASFLPSFFCSGGAFGTRGRGRRGWIFLSAGRLGGIGRCSTTNSPEDSRGVSASGDGELSGRFFAECGSRSCIVILSALVYLCR